MNRMPKTLPIDNSYHSENSRLKITENRVVKSRMSVNDSSPSRVTQKRQVADHEE